MNNYLTYDDYLFYGGLMSEYEFNNVIYEAQIKVDYHTFNRLQNDTVFTEGVKRAICKIVELINNFEKFKEIASDTQTPVVSSRSNDGVSESYGGYLGSANPQTVNEMSKQLDKDIKNIIKTYLSAERNQSGELLLSRAVY